MASEKNGVMLCTLHTMRSRRYLSIMADMLSAEGIKQDERSMQQPNWALAGMIVIALQ